MRLALVSNTARPDAAMAEARVLAGTIETVLSDQRLNGTVYAAAGEADGVVPAAQVVHLRDARDQHWAVGLWWPDEVDLHAAAGDAVRVEWSEEDGHKQVLLRVADRLRAWVVVGSGEWDGCQLPPSLPTGRATCAAERACETDEHDVCGSRRWYDFTIVGGRGSEALVPAGDMAEVDGWVFANGEVSGWSPHEGWAALDCLFRTPPRPEGRACLGGVALQP